MLAKIIFQQLKGKFITVRKRERDNHVPFRLFDKVWFSRKTEKMRSQ